ncbi:MAG TPA: dTDP-4-dehydrorhamnose reductase [Puia sp.]|nr:dTDP-4-dehydrorhamnose reductase [Puia sp.]
MKKPIILVTGANGQLGKELQVASANFPEYEFIFLSRNEMPIDDKKRIQEYFQKYQPSFCINCAAYTAVDKAESDKDAAFLMNAEAVGFLAAVCKSFNTNLVHISTDYVFNGNSSTPLKEDDLTNSVNVYGASKLKGEELAFKNNEQTIIIRTSWVYSEFGNNFVKTMIRLMNEKESVSVINDQIGSPTYAADLAEVILQIIKSNKFSPGIYNYSNQGQISWFDFAIAIKEMIGSNCKVNPIPTSQYPTPAKRPHYSLLDKSKISAVYSVEIKDWKSSLAFCINKIKKQGA